LDHNLIEHSSALEPFAEIERRGGTVTHLEPMIAVAFPLNPCRRALRENTVFVSIGWANNEIGVVQDLCLTLRIAHAKKALLFHSDAGQAPLYLSPQVHTLGVICVSLGAANCTGHVQQARLYVQDPML